MASSQPAFSSGELVSQVRIKAVQDGARSIAASIAAGILGIQSANMMDAPFTVVASGGMNILAGGSGGQKVLLNSSTGPRLVDSIPSQTFTVPNASTVNPRIDLLCGIYAQTQTSAGNGEIATLSGTTVTTSLQAIFNATEAMTYQYVTGTAASSPSVPATPSGYVALATIAVAANATSIVTGNISVLLTSAQAQILSGVAGFVNLTTNQSVAGNKIFTGVTTIGGIQFANTDAAFSGVAGIRLNSPGSILISPSSGNTISLGYDCTTLAGVYFGPINTWGYISPSGYNSPDGTGTFGTNAIVRGGYVHAGSSSANSFVNVGDGVFERNGPSGAIFLGNTGSSYLFYDGTNYNFGHGPNTIGANVNVNGAVVASSGFMTPDGGSISINAFQFGNNSTSSGLTGIGSRGVAVNGITPSILNVENIGVAQLLALDSSGNLGLSGGIAATGSIATSGSVSLNGALAVGGTSYLAGLSVSGVATLSNGLTVTSGGFGVAGGLNVASGGAAIAGSVSISGGLTVGGVQLPTTFQSTDSSVTLTNISGTLNAVLPAGYCNAYASDGSMSISPSGRTLTVTSNSVSIGRQYRPGSTPFTYTLTLPTLPGSGSVNYIVRASFSMGDMVGGGLTMTGSGATWEAGSVTQADSGVAMIQTIDYIGTATGGQAPSVALSSTTSSMAAPNYLSAFTLTATRQ